MIINTKFNVGDTTFYMSDNGFAKDKVTAIRITVIDTDIDVSYQVRDTEGGCFYNHESRSFGSLDELIGYKRTELTNLQRTLADLPY